jgi:hypothetical protein
MKAKLRLWDIFHHLSRFLRILGEYVQLLNKRIRMFKFHYTFIKIVNGKRTRPWTTTKLFILAILKEFA